MSGELSDILKHGESETCEFKGPRAPLDALARSVCGMLNQRGGVLVWGVNDQGQPVGLADAAERAKVLNTVLMRQINPHPLISVSVEQVAKKPLVRVDIPQGPDKPYSFKRDARNREIWVRVGSSTLKASSEQTSNLVERSAAQLDRWEREPMSGFSVEDCDANELSRASTEIANVGRFGDDVPTTAEELLRRLYLIRSGQLTNAAVVLFAKQPRSWMPNLAVRVVSHTQGSARAIENDTVLEGPAVRVLREAIDVIQQRTGFSGRFESHEIERRDRPAYAVFAVREGLVNALVHRDYSVLGGDVRVEIFPDHLIISNPGKLPKGWTEADLKTEHVSHLRNPDIAQVFHLRRLMEKLGTGTQELVSACKLLKARLPVWRATKNVVSLTLFRAPQPEAETRLLERQAKFLRKTAADVHFKIGDYARATSVSERQARRELVDLEAAGLVERQGKGPATAYRRTARAIP